MQTASIAISIVASPEHDLPSHPENAARFTHLDTILGYASQKSMMRIEPQAASLETINRVHPASYLEALQEAAAQGPAYVDYAPTYVTPSSYQAALNAAGGTLQVLETVLQGQARAGFAIVRPPGHHATPTRAMGFCLLNNLAIAAKSAQSSGAQRIMIVDFDVHHGNGTQDVFEEDPDVLYLSTHQWGIYPGSGELTDTGRGRGQGSVVNIPLPAGAGDRAFQAITDDVILPLGKRFSPDFLMVSAGFDAHWRDPLASLQLTEQGYHRLGTSLAELANATCQGRLLFVLEGGYDPEGLADGICAVLAGVLGEERPSDGPGSPPRGEPSIKSLLENVAAIHGVTKR